MEDSTKIYSKGEIDIIWKPSVCSHSAKCFKGLPNVFNPQKRPWVNTEGDNTENIIEQINKCPSGALSFKRKSDEAGNPNSMTNQMVEITLNGPVLIYGNITLKHQDGKEEIREKTTALCRCGNSANKPFCDGTHRKSGFIG